jgi:hypothetical protein
MGVWFAGIALVIVLALLALLLWWTNRPTSLP